MDNDFTLNLDALAETICSAEVVVVRFLISPERLLIDFRFSEVDPPLVVLVPKVNTAEERFRSLKGLRPRFRMPNKICSIWWPKYARTFVGSTLGSVIKDRMGASGFPQVVQQCDEVFATLVAGEGDEVRKCICGEGYRSLWSCEHR